MTPLEIAFPGLVPGSYRITSQFDKRYNCIAWSVRDTTQWLWPVPAGSSDWPAEVPREWSLGAFQALYEWYGFATCTSEDFEAGFEKVALFATPDGLPSHGARQLPSGRWTSKPGKGEDIGHDLRAVEGDLYGRVVRLFQRPAPV
jgi:hypothetical protein